MDVEAEQEALLTMLADKKSVAHTPQWTKEGYVTGENDIGSTYVEIDLSAQHLYFIKDGSVIMESPLVSGNMSEAQTMQHLSVTGCHLTGISVCTMPAGEAVLVELYTRSADPMDA